MSEDEYKVLDKLIKGCITGAYDFLFEGKNNEYDEEYKDYIEGGKVMDKNRFETQKEVVNLDPSVHPIQSLFTIEDLKWLMAQAEKVERIEEETDKIILEKTDKINELREEIERLNNELTGYKLANQSLSNALEKEIKTKY
jgi:hypothetical protein